MQQKIKYSFDPNIVKLKNILEQMLNCSSLEKIHELQKENCEFGLLSFETDQDTFFHKTFYKMIREDGNMFLSEYERFVKEYIAPLYNEPLLIQAIPTFRIQIPNNLGVGEFHKDKNYSHSTKEVNIFFPFTQATGNNTIWAESEEDKADYSPMEAKYGEFYIWSGANLSHGNKINDTGLTRVSMDFRILPLSEYDDRSDLESSTMKMKMKIGGYWKLMN